MNRFAVAWLLCVVTAALPAAEFAPLCPPPAERQSWMQTLPPGETRVRADSVSGSLQSELEFSGNVELLSDSQWLRADQITVIAAPRRVIAEQNILAGSDGLLISSDRAELEEAANRAIFSGVGYAFPQRKIYGKADRVEQQGQLVLMQNATYSSCPADDPDWAIRANELRLDRAQELGSVRGASLRLGDVPVMYLPWATFPIGDTRKSGLLYPAFGGSDQGGFEFSLPFYWNLAPHYDATIAPRWIQQRGTLWENELRHLSERGQARLSVNYLENDSSNGGDRHLQQIELRRQLAARWFLSADATRVSDKDYLDDFSTDLNITSLSHLSQRLDLDYFSRNLHFGARLQGYQTVNSAISAADEPYRQLPRLALTAQRKVPDKALELKLNSELVRFEHDIKQTGDRFNFNPRLSWNHRTAAYYIKPSLSWRFSQYQLAEGSVLGESQLERNTTTFSLDSGLFFDRQASADYTQTLEPRLFYVNTPYRDQSDIPLFDSSESAFSFYSLFRENRFNGSDRIGDADQLTLAITSRIIDNASGDVRFRASLGQTLYFEDRKVTLSASDAAGTQRSSYAAEVSFDPDGPWESSASLVFDNKFDNAETMTLLGRYRGTNGRIINLEYRFRENDIEQGNLSVVWPVHRRWRLLGRWLHSIEDRRHIETIAGVEYDSCCWKMQLVSRRYAADLNDEYNQSYYLQLILKGLSSQGSAARLLQNSITGYQIENE